MRRLFFAAGFSAALVQMVAVREILARAGGNEYVISVIFLVWLAGSGAGALAGGLLARRLQEPRLAFSFFLCALAVFPQFMFAAITVFFPVAAVAGVTPGFYATAAVILIAAGPYCLMAGILYPLALAVSSADEGDGAAGIYLADTGGGVAGFLLFVFLLVKNAGSAAVLVVAAVVLAAAAWPWRPRRRALMAAALATACVSVAVMFGALATAAHRAGVVERHDSGYGRVEVVEREGQTTVLLNGRPAYASRTPALAEMLVHVPASQTRNPARFLFIGAAAGMVREAEKYHPARIDYVEVDADLARILLERGLLARSASLRVTNRDPRRFVRHQAEQGGVYDVIVVAAPEPETFQENRVFTVEFFSMIRRILAPDGVFAFAAEGYENYLGPAARARFACLRATMKAVFPQVAMVPGVRTVFIGREGETRTFAIPAVLAARGIETEYLAPFFRGEVTAERLRYLEEEVGRDEAAANRDLFPVLPGLVFAGWFARSAATPVLFAVICAAFFLFVVLRLDAAEYVLMGAGFVAMAAETVAIFSFAVLHGYVYEQVGLVAGLALAGLFCGIAAGRRTAAARAGDAAALLFASDAAVVMLLAAWGWGMGRLGGGTAVCFLLVMTFAVSMLCGFQFAPAAAFSSARGRGTAGVFGADLAGGGAGVVVCGLLVAPRFGIPAALFAAALVKAAGLFTFAATRR